MTKALGRLRHAASLLFELARLARCDAPGDDLAEGALRAWAIHPVRGCGCLFPPGYPRGAWIREPLLWRGRKRLKPCAGGWVLDEHLRGRQPLPPVLRFVRQLGPSAVTERVGCISWSIQWFILERDV